MGTTQSKFSDEPDLVVDIPAEDLEPPPVPSLARQPSISTDIDCELDPITSVYTKQFHTIVKTMDMEKTLPAFVPGNVMDSTIILDETGSMASMKDEPVQSLNSYIDVQRTSGFNVNITVVRFNEYIRYTLPLSVHDPNLTISDYEPNGMTALFDAIIFGILTATTPQNVVIITDGANNSSMKRLDELNTLIERAEACGWIFTFIGCTREAYEQGTQIKTLSNPVYTNGCDMNLEGAPPPPTLSRAMTDASEKINYINRQNAE